MVLVISFDPLGGLAGFVFWGEGQEPSPVEMCSLNPYPGR